MNNSFQLEQYDEVLEESKVIVLLREREAKLVRLVESLVGLSKSREWSTLKSQLFDEVLESIETRLRNESVKTEINTAELYRLQGERKWARNYADPLKLAKEYQVELANIRKQLNPLAEQGI